MTMLYTALRSRQIKRKLTIDRIKLNHMTMDAGWQTVGVD